MSDILEILRKGAGPKDVDRAADEITRLRAESEKLRAALANSELPCVYCTLPKEEWGKCEMGFPGCGRADDAMGCPELGARMEADAFRAENERLREALKPFSDAASTDDYIDDVEVAETDTARKITFGDLRRARAAIEGVTEPASPWRDIESAPNDQIILVYDKSASTKIVAAFLSEGGWLYAEGFEADPEGPIPTHWMPLPELPK